MSASELRIYTKLSFKKEGEKKRHFQAKEFSTSKSALNELWKEIHCRKKTDPTVIPEG